MKRVNNPAFLGLDDIDLQDNTAPYASPILFVGNQFQWNAFLHIVNTGAAATLGLASFTLTFYDDEAGTNVVATKVLASSINTKIDGQESLSWGGTGFSHDGTGTPASGGDAFSVGSEWMRITVTVTEENNAGTSCVGNVWLTAEHSRPD